MMTAEEYVAVEKALGLRRVHLARLLDVDARTLRRYASGSVAPPVAMALLLSAMAAYPCLLKDAERALTERSKKVLTMA